MTRVLKLAESGVDAAADAVLEALAGPGAVVLLPTETVYGLVCRADDAAARQRIYDLKDRDASKPLGWFVADWRMLAGYGVRLEGLPEQLAVRHCPGPITIIAPRQDGGTTGFRVPDHPLVLAVLRRLSARPDQREPLRASERADRAGGAGRTLRRRGAGGRRRPDRTGCAGLHRRRCDREGAARSAPGSAPHLKFFRFFRVPH